MSLTNTRWVRNRLLAAAAILSATACAGDPAEVREPRVEKSELKCAHDETLSCVEKVGKTVSCTCSSREDLRDILEPNQQ